MILSELKNRDLIQEISDEPGIEALPKGSKLYTGIDPTSPYLQLGNLVTLLASVHLAKAGLDPIVLLGGATGSIGDPRETSERSLLGEDTLAFNVTSISEKLKEIFDRLNVKVEVVNNLDWTKDLSALKFLRDIGKYFTINYMTAKETVKTRLVGDGISYTEFSYMLLQAYDFYTLCSTKNCLLQIGGSDQWGNMTSGLELIRKKNAGNAFCFSLKLITDGAGKKLGKSEGNALWLDSRGTSPYKLHQFLLNTPDEDAIKLLKTLTLLTLDQIAELKVSLKTVPHKRLAQKALADYICWLIHGQEIVDRVNAVADKFFSGSYKSLSAQELDEVIVSSGFPVTEIDQTTLEKLDSIELLMLTKQASSRREAKTFLKNGAVYVNNERMAGPLLGINCQILSGMLPLYAGGLIVKVGKKNYHFVKIKGN